MAAQASVMGTTQERLCLDKDRFDAAHDIHDARIQSLEPLQYEPVELASRLYQSLAGCIRSVGHESVEPLEVLRLGRSDYPACRSSCSTLRYVVVHRIKSALPRAVRQCGTVHNGQVS